VSVENALSHAYATLPAINRIERRLVLQDAQIENLVAALSAVGGGEGFDEAKLLAGVKKAAEDGARAVLTEGAQFDVSITPRQDG